MSGVEERWRGSACNAQEASKHTTDQTDGRIELNMDAAGEAGVLDLGADIWGSAGPWHMLAEAGTTNHPKATLI